MTNHNNPLKMALALESAIIKLNEALAIAQNSMTEETHEKCRRVVGICVGRISHDLIDPLYEQDIHLQATVNARLGMGGPST